jgi:hypothetical protein
VFYHPAAWDGIPGRQRLLLEAISHHVPVIYIEETEERKRRVTFEKRTRQVTIVRGLATMLVKFQRRHWNVAMWLWCWWHLGWIRRRYRKVIFWNSENWLRPNRFIAHDVLVYDCIDPCFSADPRDLRLFEQRELELLGLADVVFASAQLLVDNCRRHHHDVTLLNNGCDPNEYSENKIASARRPQWWPRTEEPIAAYLGTLDWRFDFRCVRTACRMNPGVHFILAGGFLRELEAHVAELRSMPNVTITGRISLEDGRYLLSRCAIGLIPFTAGEMNDAINPVKLYAYALLGKPVVGTAIRELILRPEVARVGHSPEEFAEKVAEAVALRDDENLRRSLIAFALGNTWENRARQALARLIPEQFGGANHRTVSRRQPVATEAK